MLDTAAFPVPQCLTAAEAAVGRQSSCLCHCPHADFSLTGVSISPCRPQAWGLLIWASGQWNFSGAEERESGQFPATLQMTRSAGSSPESPRAFYQSQLLLLISLPPLPSSTLGPFKLFGVSFGCQWQWLWDTVSVAEVLERQITTSIPAIAKEPGDSGDYSITGYQVSQHRLSANLPSHQEQDPGWYMGLSGWNRWAVRNHQVHSASAGWSKASLGSCSFVLKQMHEGLCSEKQHCQCFSVPENQGPELWHQKTL